MKSNAQDFGPAYVAAHHMINGFNEKRAFELIKLNEHEEFLNYFPEYAQEFTNIERKLTRFSATTKFDWYDIIRQHSSMMDRMDFAIDAKETNFPALMFYMLDLIENSPKEWLYSLPTDKALEHLKGLE